MPSEVTNANTTSTGTNATRSRVSPPRRPLLGPEPDRLRLLDGSYCRTVGHRAHILYEPPNGEAPTADIVLVHGLNSGELSCWREASGRLWPGALLPKDYPRCRIVTVGYQSGMIKSGDGADLNLLDAIIGAGGTAGDDEDTATEKDNNNSITNEANNHSGDGCDAEDDTNENDDDAPAAAFTIDDCARLVHDVLLSPRVDIGGVASNPLDPSLHRPIIFVVHSLGGLVVKQLLLAADGGGEAESAVGAAMDAALVRCVKGIVFYSTPHFGSSVARYLNYTDGALLSAFQAATSMFSSSPNANAAAAPSSSTSLPPLAPSMGDGTARTAADAHGLVGEMDGGAEAKGAEAHGSGGVGTALMAAGEAKVATVIKTLSDGNLLHLHRLNRHFLRIATTHQIPVLAFGEGLREKGLLMVVREDSSDPLYPYRERADASALASSSVGPSSSSLFSSSSPTIRYVAPSTGESVDFSLFEYFIVTDRPHTSVNLPNTKEHPIYAKLAEFLTDRVGYDASATVGLTSLYPAPRYLPPAHAAASASASGLSSSNTARSKVAHRRGLSNSPESEAQRARERAVAAVEADTRRLWRDILELLIERQVGELPKPTSTAADVRVFAEFADASKVASSDAAVAIPSSSSASRNTTRCERLRHMSAISPHARAVVPGAVLSALAVAEELLSQRSRRIGHLLVIRFWIRELLAAVRGVLRPPPMEPPRPLAYLPSLESPSSHSDPADPTTGGGEGLPLATQLCRSVGRYELARVRSLHDAIAHCRAVLERVDTPPLNVSPAMHSAFLFASLASLHGAMWAYRGGLHCLSPLAALGALDWAKAVAPHQQLPLVPSGIGIDEAVASLAAVALTTDYPSAATAEWVEAAARGGAFAAGGIVADARGLTLFSSYGAGEGTCALLTPDAARAPVAAAVSSQDAAVQGPLASPAKHCAEPLTTAYLIDKFLAAMDWDVPVPCPLAEAPSLSASTSVTRQSKSGGGANEGDTADILTRATSALSDAMRWTLGLSSSHPSLSAGSTPKKALPKTQILMGPGEATTDPQKQRSSANTSSSPSASLADTPSSPLPLSAADAVAHRLRTAAQQRSEHLLAVYDDDAAEAAALEEWQLNAHQHTSAVLHWVAASAFGELAMADEAETCFVEGGDRPLCSERQAEAHGKESTFQSAQPPIALPAADGVPPHPRASSVASPSPPHKSVVLDALSDGQVPIPSAPSPSQLQANGFELVEPSRGVKRGSVHASHSGASSSRPSPSPSAAAAAPLQPLGREALAVMEACVATMYCRAMRPETAMRHASDMFGPAAVPPRIDESRAAPSKGDINEVVDTSDNVTSAHEPPACELVRAFLLQQGAAHEYSLCLSARAHMRAVGLRERTAFSAVTRRASIHESAASGLIRRRLRNGGDNTSSSYAGRDAYSEEETESFVEAVRGHPNLRTLWCDVHMVAFCLDIEVSIALGTVERLAKQMGIAPSANPSLLSGPFALAMAFDKQFYEQPCLSSTAPPAYAPSVLPPSPSASVGGRGRGGSRRVGAVTRRDLRSVRAMFDSDRASRVHAAAAAAVAAAGGEGSSSSLPRSVQWLASLLLSTGSTSQQSPSTSSLPLKEEVSLAAAEVGEALYEPCLIGTCAAQSLAQLRVPAAKVPPAVPPSPKAKSKNGAAKRGVNNNSSSSAVRVQVPVHEDVFTHCKLLFGTASAIVAHRLPSAGLSNTNAASASPAGEGDGFEKSARHLTRPSASLSRNRAVVDGGFIDPSHPSLAALRARRAFLGGDYATAIVMFRRQLKHSSDRSRRLRPDSLLSPAVAADVRVALGWSYVCRAAATRRDDGLRRVLEANIAEGRRRLHEAREGRLAALKAKHSASTDAAANRVASSEGSNPSVASAEGGVVEVLGKALFGMARFVMSGGHVIDGSSSKPLIAGTKKDAGAVLLGPSSHTHPSSSPCAASEGGGEATLSASSARLSPSLRAALDAIRWGDALVSATRPDECLSRALSVAFAECEGAGARGINAAAMPKPAMRSGDAAAPSNCSGLGGCAETVAAPQSVVGHSGRDYDAEISALKEIITELEAIAAEAAAVVGSGQNGASTTDPHAYGHLPPSDPSADVATAFAIFSAVLAEEPTNVWALCGRGRCLTLSADGAPAPSKAKASSAPSLSFSSLSSSVPISESANEERRVATLSKAMADFSQCLALSGAEGQRCDHAAHCIAELSGDVRLMRYIGAAAAVGGDADSSGVRGDSVANDLLLEGIGGPFSIARREVITDGARWRALAGTDGEGVVSFFDDAPQPTAANEEAVAAAHCSKGVPPAAPPLCAVEAAGVSKTIDAAALSGSGRGPLLRPKAGRYAYAYRPSSGPAPFAWCAPLSPAEQTFYAMAGGPAAAAANVSAAVKAINRTATAASSFPSSSSSSSSSVPSGKLPISALGGEAFWVHWEAVAEAEKHTGQQAEAFSGGEELAKTAATASSLPFAPFFSLVRSALRASSGVSGSSPDQHAKSSSPSPFAVTADEAAATRVLLTPNLQRVAANDPANVWGAAALYVWGVEAAMLGGGSSSGPAPNSNSSKAVLRKRLLTSLRLALRKI